MGNHGLNPSTKQREQIVNQLSLCAIPGNGGLEDVKVPNFLDSANGPLVLEAVNHRLNSGVSRAPLFRERLLDLPNGCDSANPQRLHNPKLEFRQSEFRHLVSYISMHVYYSCRCNVKRIIRCVFGEKTA